MGLSIIETLVVFAGIPLAVVAVIYGLVYAGGARSNDRRYRPGRPFDFQPVWFLSAPEQHASAANSHASGGVPAAHAVSGANRQALTKAEESTAGGPVGDTTGGASDRW
jgi:hypothetical protein